MARHYYKQIPGSPIGVSAGTIQFIVKCTRCGQEQSNYHHRPPDCPGNTNWRDYEPDPWKKPRRRTRRNRK